MQTVDGGADGEAVQDRPKVVGVVAPHDGLVRAGALELHCAGEVDPTAYDSIEWRVLEGMCIAQGEGAGLGGEPHPAVG